MFEMIQGPAGSYKSYQATVRIINEIVRGGVVATNLHMLREPLKEELLKRFSWQMNDDQLIELTQEQMPEFYKHTPAGTPDCPVLIVCEELGRTFNARDWANTSRKLLDFLALRRHEYNDLLGIDQAAANVDKQFRRLVDMYYNTVSIQNLPGLGWTPKGWYSVVHMCRDGKTAAKYKLYHAKRWVFNCYDSYSKKVMSFDRMAMTVKRHNGKVKKGGFSMKGIFILAVLAIVVSGGCRYYYNNRKSASSPAPAPSAPVPYNTPALPSVVPLVPSAVSSAPPSVKGTMIFQGGKKCALVGGKVYVCGASYDGRRLLDVRPDGLVWRQGTEIRIDSF